MGAILKTIKPRKHPECFEPKGPSNRRFEDPFKLSRDDKEFELSQKLD